MSRPDSAPGARPRGWEPAAGPRAPQGVEFRAPMVARPGSFRAWLRALRPLAQLNVAPPIVAGAALLSVPGHALEPRGLAVALGFGLLAHAFIVLANDAGDAEADAVAGRRTLVSGGSGVIPEGLLSRGAVARAAALAAVLLAGYGAAWSVAAGSVLPLVCAGATLVLVWAYGLPPLRRAYADGGAYLQAAGVGVVLPAVGALGQGIVPPGSNPAAFVPLVLLGWAGNVATAIPDRAGDGAAGKRTLPVRLGEAVARRRVVEVGILAALCSPLAVPRAPTFAHAVLELSAAGVYLAAQRLPPVGFAVATGAVGVGLELAWTALALGAFPP